MPRTLGATVVTMIGLLAASLPGHAQTAPRAVWLWEPDVYRMLDDPAERAAALDLMRDGGITTVYVYADEYEGRNAIRDEPEKYRTLVRELNARGLLPYALLGSAPLNTPRYVLPKERAKAEAMFRRVLDYNAASAPEERFVGVNIDIEPYLLSDWADRRDLRALQFLDVSRRFMEMLEESGQSLDVGPAIPFWFDGIDGIEFEGAVKPLNQHVQDIYDYVALMDYRDFAEGPDGILFHGEAEMAYGDEIGRPVVIGVETVTMPSNLEKLTFVEEGLAVMETELGLVTRAWGDRPGFGGFAIHHFRSWRRLGPGEARDGGPWALLDSNQ